MTEPAHESPAHAFRIRKSDGLGDLLDRLRARFDPAAGRIRAQPFNRLGRRLTSLRAKCTAEVTRADACNLRKALDRQRLSDMLLRKAERAPDAIRFRLEI